MYNFLKLTALTLAIACVAFSASFAQDSGEKMKGQEKAKGAMEKGKMAGDKAKGKLEKAAAKMNASKIVVKDSQGVDHMLGQYKDKIVVLEWTNKGCPYVVRHYKEKTMVKLAQEFAKKGVVWLAVDSSHFAKAEDIEAWRKEQGIPYPVLLDTNGALGHAFGAKTTPHMFIVKGGETVYQGAIDDNPRGKNEAPTNYVRTALEQLLAGKDVSKAKSDPYGCGVKYSSPKVSN